MEDIDAENVVIDDANVVIGHGDVVISHANDDDVDDD